MKVDVLVVTVVCGVRVDPEETLRLYYEKIHSRHAELVAKEAEWLSQQKIDMVRQGRRRTRKGLFAW